MPPRLYAFGEVLWDVFPGEEIPGGAPLNVALHAHQLGAEAHVVSAIGDDVRGERIRTWLENRGLSTKFIYENAGVPTGTVHVDLRNPEEVRYRINAPAAWDQIPNFPQGIRSEDVLVFGSLACRTEANWHLLLPYLLSPALRVLDLNLRAPFYSRKAVIRLLAHCDVLKVNEAEFLQLQGWFGGRAQEEGTVRAWMRRFGFSQLCLTRGAQGALLFCEHGRLSSRVFETEVVDTIGCGDAFLAALLVGMMQKRSAKQCLDEAAALGALVAGTKGGTPMLAWPHIRELMSREVQFSSSGPGSSTA